MNRIVLLCLFVASAAVSAPADSGAAPELPHRIQTLLTAKPRGQDLSALVEFTETPGFPRLPASDRLAILKAVNRCALAAGDFDRAVQAAHQSMPLQTQSVLEELRRKSATGYASNRARLTTIPNSLRGRLLAVVQAAVAARDWSAASIHAFQCLSVFPDAPDARTTALTAAECSLVLFRE